MAQFSNQGSAADNLIRSSAPTTNYGANIAFIIGDSGLDTDRGLIKWDLSTIPTTAIVTDATLTLTVNDGSAATNGRTLRAFRVLRNWTEGGSTWNTYDGSNNWGTAGCDNTTSDREATDVGSVSVSATPSGTVALPLTASKVQEMINGTITNYGWLLKVDTENEDSTNYHSSQAASSTNKPKLVINYTLPTAGGTINGYFEV